MKQGAITVTPPRLDIYSLSLIAFRMLAGKLPADDERSIRSVFENMPADLYHLIATCLDSEPAHRPDDAVMLHISLEFL